MLHHYTYLKRAEKANNILAVDLLIDLFIALCSCFNK